MGNSPRVRIVRSSEAPCLETLRSRPRSVCVLSLHPAGERFRVTPPRSWTGAVLDVDTGDPPRAWYRQIGARVRRNVLLKAIGTPVAIFVFFLAYRHLLNYPMFPVTEMPLTVLDDVIGFYPPALLLYVSLWLYVSIPPALLRSRRELIEYTWAIGGLCLVGLACFLLWPTSVPPLDFDRGRHPGFGILQGLDAAGNACPSLHVAAALFSAIWLRCTAPRDASWLGDARSELVLGAGDRVFGDGDQAARGDRRAGRGDPGCGRGRAVGAISSGPRPGHGGRSGRVRNSSDWLIASQARWRTGAAAGWRGRDR